MEQEQPDTKDLEARLAAQEVELAAVRRERLLMGKIAATIELDKLLDILVDEMDLVCDFDSLMINFADKRRENLVCEKARLPEYLSGMEKTYRKYAFPMSSVDANVECYVQKRVITVDRGNSNQFGEDTALRFKRSNMHSLVVIPIMLEDSSEEAPLGTIMLFRVAGPIDPVGIAAIQKLLPFFGKQISVAFLYKEAEEHEREVEMAIEEQQRFIQFVNRTNALNSLAQIYDSISADFLRRFPFDLFAILVREGDELVAKKFLVIDEQYEGVCSALEEYYGDTHYNLDIGDGATAICFQQNKPLFFPDVQQILKLPMSEKDRQGLQLMKSPYTFAIVPILRAEKPVGVIWLISLGRPVCFSESQRKLVELLCSFIGTALANAELYTLAQEQKQKIEMLNFSLKLKVEELRDLSAKDRLTGLNNFGFFEEELGRRVHEYGRELMQNQLSLVILDVDHFKKFNDTYGYVAGNAVLQEVAQRTSRLARKMDIVCRYGGEEFAILLPKCDLEGARLFAERVRQDIESRPFVTEGVEARITVSLGCAQFDGEEESTRFVQRADRALYRAKENGRNRVEVATDEGDVMMNGTETQ